MPPRGSATQRSHNKPNAPKPFKVVPVAKAAANGAVQILLQVERGASSVLPGFAYWRYRVYMEGASSGQFGLTLDGDCEIVDPSTLDVRTLPVNDQQRLRYAIEEIDGRIAVWKTISQEEADAGDWTIEFLASERGSARVRVGLIRRNANGVVTEVDDSRFLPGPRSS